MFEDIVPPVSWLVSALSTDHAWIALSAVVSALVAFATFQLARDTRRLADETATTIRESRLANVLAEKHHQESLAPLVVAEVSLTHQLMRGSVPPVFAGGAAIVEHLHLKGHLFNSGSGPAARVYVSVWFDDDRCFPTQELLSVGANQERKFGLSSDIPYVPESMYLPNVPTDLKYIPFRIETRYTSIFGGEGLTVQSSHTGRAEDMIIDEKSSYFTKSVQRDTDGN